MSRARFVSVDRETPMLLPPDLRDWVADDDLVHFIMEAVQASDLSTARINERGSGDAQYPPGMMLAVLIYCYATGLTSSRQIERATYHHVSVRYLAGNTHPDHDTLCKFRRENLALFQSVFTQVLTLGACLGMGRIGTICLDGTKMLADAAKRRTLNTQQLLEFEEKLQGQIEELLAKAEAADQQGTDEDGTKLPRELAHRQRLQTQVRAAREQLRAHVEERARERQKEIDAWHREPEPFGRAPEARAAEPQHRDCINLTDPQSGLMPVPGRRFVQGYNAQIAISGEPEGGLIVAASVCTEPNDRTQLEPMATAVQTALVPMRQLIVDSGYDNVKQIRGVIARGVEVICAPQKDGVRKADHEASATPESAPAAPAGSEAAQGAEESTEQKSTPARVSRARQAAQELRNTLRTEAESPAGRRALRLRSRTVEPIFGHIKHVMGIRRFRLRGLNKVNAEWQLITLAFNCRRVVRRRAQKRAQTGGQRS